MHLQIEDDIHAEYGAEIEKEESKIAPNRASKQNLKITLPTPQAPYALIEGPEPS